MTTAIQYHSQPATRQDEWVIEKLRGKRGGYFVEVGAHDGFRHSNTLTLEQAFDWTGILVEPNPDLYRYMVNNRPGCLHDQSVIAGEQLGSQSFFMGEGVGAAFSGLANHMSREWYMNHQQHGAKLIRVNTTTLHDLLMRHRAPRWIDYLSIDVEGAEFAILEGYVNRSHGQFAFGLITVEFRYDKLLLNELEHLLHPVYILDEVRAFDACFVHRNLR